MASQDKSYRCASCNAEFNSQDELDKHMRSAHKGSSTESRSGESPRPTDPKSGSGQRDRGKEMPR